MSGEDRLPEPPPRFGGSSGDRPERSELLASFPGPFDPGLSHRPLEELPGIGDAFSAAAAELGIETIGDLLWRLPRAYGQRPGTGLLGELEPGESTGVEVRVMRARRVRTRRRRFSVVEARIADDSGVRKAVWFNQPWMADKLAEDSHWYLEGRLEKGGFVVSAAEPLEGAPPGPVSGDGVAWTNARATLPALKDESPRSAHSSGGEIGPGRWRRWAFEACRRAGALGEPLPSSLLRSRRLPGLASSLREAHFPLGEERAGEARKRLAYQELLVGQLATRQRRERARAGKGPSPVLVDRSGGADGWLRTLPFAPTADQSEAIARVRADLGRTTPMNRLLMGEVGSGKTVVAIHAMLVTVGSGHQAAFLAPTEVLADQHYETVRHLLGDAGPRVDLLTGSTPPAGRNRTLEGLGEGSVDIVVGTHALLEEPVAFRRLGLAVIDEEHRFGVRQRAAFDPKAPEGRSVHALHMSATPIPRTLALTTYGDLDVTSLRELPTGRVPVKTEVVSAAGRAAAFERLRTELDRGRQAFVVCPLVEESPALEGRAAASEAERLGREELSGYEVGLLHGQMKPSQKQVAMAAFADGRTDVLVATTVIEVGIDVPNASVMVIEGAERFGLSQLHQLRGRIGRGEHGGTCFLFSESPGASSARRLASLASVSDGFRLAEIDLEMRGEGELGGTRQHGLPRFRVASLPRDLGLLEAARDDLASLDAVGRELLLAEGAS